ncbi:hypothetical protein IMCC26207_107153 [Actinobacteria bacterium IMCC26207]|nr:hypothetical protein IMCC26207_107153 [Actinobacteria bacterium IMCC26207]
MNPEVDSPKSHNLTSKAERSASPARRFGAGLLAVAIAAAGFLALPQQASAATLRTVSTSLSCTTTSLTLGATTTCSGGVTDTDTGTKNVPDGTAEITVDSGKIAVLTACTLAYVATANKSECSFKIIVLAIGDGTPNLKLAFTSTDSHANSNKTLGLTTSGSTFKQYSAQTLTSGKQGASLTVFSVGCASASTRYIGAFVSTVGDPATAGRVNTKVWETSPAADGSFQFDTALEAAHPTGSFYTRFYCANASPSSYSAESILSTSSLYTYVVSAAAVAGAAARTGPAADTRGLAGLFSSDPDDTSGIDNEFIPGAQMITLKQRVDAAAPIVSRVDRLSQAFLGKIPPRYFVDLWVKNLAAGKTDAQLVVALAATPEYFWSYALLTPTQFVDRAYFMLLGRVATAAERSTMVNALTTGKQSPQAALGAIASSPEHIMKTANRSYVTAAYQALTTIMPTQALLGQYTNDLNDRGSKVAMLENLALSRSAFENWIAALAANPANARF